MTLQKDFAEGPMVFPGGVLFFVSEEPQYSRASRQVLEDSGSGVLTRPLLFSAPPRRCDAFWTCLSSHLSCAAAPRRVAVRAEWSPATRRRASRVVERPLPPARLRPLHSVSPYGIAYGSTLRDAGNVVGCLP